MDKFYMSGFPFLKTDLTFSVLFKVQKYSRKGTLGFFLLENQSTEG